MPTFADASYYVALMDPKDRFHEDAVALLAYADSRSPLHIHALALGEVIAVIGSSKGGKAARQAYLGIRDTATILAPVVEDLDEAMSHVVRYDGELSLSEALFLHCMAREEGSEILSFDAGFDRPGVRRISKPKGTRS